MDFDSLEATDGGDKPFETEPFDAGVQADEETDPKKYIQQLSGKLGQSLRKYTDESGQPDLELEKFAINSVISATHTADMDEEDKNDIISKINTSGDENDNEDSNNTNDANDAGGDEALPDETEIDSGEMTLENIEVLDKERKPLFADPTLGVDQLEETVQNILENILKENFDGVENSSIFVGKETTMASVELDPVIAPPKPITTEPQRIKRKDKPFSIPVKPGVTPQPKANL